MDRSLTDLITPVANFQYQVLRTPRPTLRHAGSMATSDPDDLPRAYRIGLRLRELGADDDLIGECLGMDPAGVSTLIEIGRQKLVSEQHSTQHIGLSGSDSPASAG
jgi:hypothetical protein